MVDLSKITTQEGVDDIRKEITGRKTTYYDILGVARNASEEAINTAYKKLSLQLHPDKNLGDLFAGEKFKLIGDAVGGVGGLVSAVRNLWSSSNLFPSSIIVSLPSPINLNFSPANKSPRFLSG